MFRRLIYLVCFVSVLHLASNANASVELVGGDTLNGNFNGLITPSTVDGQPFSNVVTWENIGTGDQETQCTRANLNFDGSRNAVLSGGDARDFALDTVHTISVGEYFDISYVWRDASNWDDGSDQVRVRLFVTDDNTINGTRTDLVEDFSELSTQNSTYEAVDHDAIYVAVPADSGKTLFVVIDTTASSNEFARLDNFTLEVGRTYTASVPNPNNNAVDVLIDADLSWTPGALAAKHDVYLGTVFDDVNNADITAPLGVLVSAGQDPNTFDPEILFELGQTYYWRIDEVNDLEPDSPWKGHVWSFTAEPVAIPIEDVNATASSANRPDEGPQNTVNGSGLDEDDLHSSESAAMWLSSLLDPNAPWIQYELDRVHKLYEMSVWNHNTSSESGIGYGIREATIEHSVDGANWTTLGTTHEFAQAPGLSGYASNTTVDLAGVAARYIKIIPNSNWGGFLPQFGLSEVRFLSVPVLAREPSPDPGATDVDVDVTLSWRAGREAARHDVYLSTDEQAVIDGTAPVMTVTEASYAPSLDLAGTYYWRIDEVNDAEIPTIWQSDIWNLSTQEYLVVDDFESYNDIEAGQEGSNLIYLTWVDGFENPSVNGSTIGYTVPFEPTMETSLVYDGTQSVPLFYNNTVAASSEVTANIAALQAGQVWTKHAVKALTLRFHGDPNNSVNDQMYVKVNGSKVTYGGDAANLTRAGWQMWYIDLASIGASLNNVTTLSIGFERAGAFGGQGVVYLDGIRLYSHDRQVVTPADLGTIGLQAHYEFEGNTNDSSGNARHGTAVENPTYVAGKVGQATHLRGLDYVVITGYKGVLDANAFSIAAWIRTTLPEIQQIVYYGTQTGGQRCEFRVDDSGDVRMGNGGGQINSFATVNDGGWHHVVVTISENATNSSSDVRVYIDGQDDTEETTDLDPLYGIVADWDVTIGYRPSQSDRGFQGDLDDVRIYDRVLSPEEAAWLAGRTKDFDKPF